MDRYLIRGGLYAIISLSLACYEALTRSPVRYELIIGYGLVFIFGIFTIITRQKRPDYKKIAFRKKMDD
ncbi:MAG: hypothetical protein D6814_05635 [Calditrichaeota bacterium]|nr:MAG: hypothetical protein D6814_05635 [Calditrichota bacterium]